MGECFRVDDAVPLVARGQDEEIGRRVGGTERRVVHASRHDDGTPLASFDGVPDPGRITGIRVLLPDQLEHRAPALVQRPRFDQAQYPLALYPLRNAEGVYGTVSPSGNIANRNSVETRGHDVDASESDALVQEHIPSVVTHGDEPVRTQQWPLAVLLVGYGP